MLGAWLDASCVCGTPDRVGGTRRDESDLFPSSELLCSSSSDRAMNNDCLLHNSSPKPHFMEISLDGDTYSFNLEQLLIYFLSGSVSTGTWKKTFWV